MTTPTVSNYRLTVSECLRCHLISRDPLIIISYGLPLGAPIKLCPHLADRKASFLMGNWWSFLDPGLLAQTRYAYSLLREMYPLHDFIFLTNSREECRLLEQAGLPSYFCHHNAFLDESIFRPLPGLAKTMDAVYTARLLPFKRHALARHIPSWGLVYYFDPSDQDRQRAYLSHLRRIMPNMACRNHDPDTDAYAYLTPHQVCRVYNTARVGLCLSQLEGGNYATTEYMLSGLPVVSTISQGGRDHYLDPDISRVVEPDPEAVAGAVADLVARNIPPRLVRLRALVKIQEHRQDFIRLVEAIIQKEGGHGGFAERFGDVFKHKMLTYPGTPEAFLAGHGLL